MSKDEGGRMKDESKASVLSLNSAQQVALCLKRQRSVPEGPNVYRNSAPK
jgi:hypothetical protein